MVRICLDAGHGGPDPGAIYKGRKESDDTLALGKAVAAELRRHGVLVDETRTVDTTVSLAERVYFENRQSYDYFISLHRNAFKPPEQAKGVETYTYLNPRAKTKGLAEKIQAALVSIGFTDRGVKAANFHVLRETKAPAVLVEVGFIDNTGDNQLFDAKRDEIVAALTGAILEQLGIPIPRGEAVEVKVIVKDKELFGKLIDGQTWVPLRSLIEALSPEVIWDEKDKTVIVI